MAENWNPGSLLGQSFPLASGVRVRLRLARSSDLAAITDLHLRRTGRFPDRLETWAPERLVQFDPRRRYVVCATALIDSAERLLGMGVIDLGAEVSQPEVLIADAEVGQDLPELLDRALRSLAAAAGRTRAA